MNPFFISALIGKILDFKRICLKCQRPQLVPSELKYQNVPCKFCGTVIPPNKMER